jgi:pilus assembly protein TadC
VFVVCGFLVAVSVLAWAPAPPLNRIATVVGAWPVRRASSAVLGSGERSSAQSRWQTDHGRMQLAVASSTLLGLSISLIVGGVPGVLVGAGVAVGTGLAVRRLEPAAVVREREQLVRDLPVAIDLLTACIASGSPPLQCLEAVAQAVSGPVARQLEQATTKLRMGADPVAVWAAMTSCAPMAPLARTMLRAVETGAPVADGLNRLVDDQRRARRWDSERRARAVGVKAAAPLGLCFLPAFIAIGIVPTIVSTFLHMHL